MHIVAFSWHATQCNKRKVTQRNATPLATIARVWNGWMGSFDFDFCARKNGDGRRGVVERGEDEFGILGRNA